MKLFWEYFISRIGTAALAAVLCGVMLLCGWLSGLERGAILYCLLLWAAICAVALAAGFTRFFRRHQALEDAARKIILSPGALPQPGDRLEEDYQQLLELVLADRTELRKETDRRYREQRDTFTLWAHQIKNPIAAMGLLLQQEPVENRSELEQELFEIEQYVDMVLNYLRLGSESTDFVLRRCELDEVIRKALKKYAKQFIRRRISLEYEETGLTVLTDEKWLGFVLEQLLSNALKYTVKGTIHVFAENNSLKIRDTGMGIAAEDLPRVFEKGYTGYNGRTDKKSTGLGLWLCRRVLHELGHEISLTSAPGEGTEVTIAFVEDDPAASE